MNSLDGFVKLVMSHTASQLWRELADIHRKSMHDLLERNVAHLDNVLETLSVDKYSISFERTVSQVQVLTPLLNSTEISYIPDIYVFLFRKVYEYFVKIKKKPIILQSVLKILYSRFLLRLKSCRFNWSNFQPENGIPLLVDAIDRIIPEHMEGPYMNPKWVLLYFYYGGLIYGAQGRYEEAFEMMQKVCSIPTVVTSSIQVHAYKKYVLLSLLLHEKIIPLPHYRSPAVMRTVSAACQNYIALSKIYTNEEKNFDKAGAVREYLEAHQDMLDSKYVLLSLLLHEKIIPLPHYRSPAVMRTVSAACQNYIALSKIYTNEEKNFDKAGAVREYLEAHQDMLDSYSVSDRFLFLS
ncbi:unnamed protein product [Gongylonema pulchrum]|uniref:COP9 signalosome complex subunit 3 n=1 Tax=Gongylonema pulchrum TaxID=637853 RepID=A0A183DWF9_9BILA|nr:unnamed protein product [Gongylonema pulchrum]